jgi:hypothetical protein
MNPNGSLVEHYVSDGSLTDFRKWIPGASRFKMAIVARCAALASAGGDREMQMSSRGKPGERRPR